MSLKNKIICITGGTGSFGQKFTEIALKQSPAVIRIYSRGELLQKEMEQKFNDPRLRFFIGDVRDKDRLRRALTGTDIVVHAAALKQVPVAEYNPIEAVRTNIGGTINVIDCAIDMEIEKVIAISSDKAVHPVNLYGATKMVMEKLFTQANVYSKTTRFSCVRYGNVIGSRGSVIPLLKEFSQSGVVKITDERMTRFWITLEQGAQFVVNCLSTMRGGEIFVPKIPSTRLIDLASTIAPKAKKKFIGIRPGEKLHEVLITEDEARHTREHEDYYVIHPEFPYWTTDSYLDMTGKELPDGFRYTSDTNSQRLAKAELERLLNNAN